MKKQHTHTHRHSMHKGDNARLLNIPLCWLGGGGGLFFSPTTQAASHMENTENSQPMSSAEPFTTSAAMSATASS